MMQQHNAETLSSLLGLLGSMLLAIPFFTDFFAKRGRLKKLAGLEDGVFSPEDAAELRKPVEKIGLEAVLEADVRMALCAALGCLLLVGSFAILLLQHS